MRYDTPDAVATPWYRVKYGVPEHLDYPECSMAEAVEAAARRYPSYTACDFMGSRLSYKKLAVEIERCARALRAAGIRPDDRVTIALPNMPQAVVAFYAVNMVGAIANMIHPLSAEGEISFYLNDSRSAAAIVLDSFYPKFAAVRHLCPALRTLIVASVADELNPAMKIGYALTEGRKVAHLPRRQDYLTWKQFMKGADGFRGDPRVPREMDDPAVILYSGGTTGTTKGILLSNMNFNALGVQIVATNTMFVPGDKMLAIMPMFHGFGLGVSIHAMLINGGRCLLVPRFTPQTYAELLEKFHPNYIAGVPTLYEALLRLGGLENLDLSCLKGMFSGGDSLSIDLKRRIDRFLRQHKASIEVREGYGMAECIAASCLTPPGHAREGSIGVPFPDTYYKIVRPGSMETLPYRKDGEICISGPTVMLGYANHPEETAATRRVHPDGQVWIHTGDLGMMDPDGYVYFRQRIKRMIVTSGYNVYPSRIENLLNAHPLVHMSCVIGVKDPYRMHKVKAFVVLKSGVEPDVAAKQKLMDYCRRNIAKYAMPCDIVFRDSLPLTSVGKVAYRVLEAEEEGRQE